MVVVGEIYTQTGMVMLVSVGIGKGVTHEPERTEEFVRRSKSETVAETVAEELAMMSELETVAEELAMMNGPETVVAGGVVAVGKVSMGRWSAETTEMEVVVMSEALAVAHTLGSDSSRPSRPPANSPTVMSPVSVNTGEHPCTNSSSNGIRMSSSGGIRISNVCSHDNSGRCGMISSRTLVAMRNVYNKKQNK
jgi:hypothetical protein